MIDVKKIAKLARLGLEKNEEKKFEKELAAILDFVEKLNQAQTDGIEPTAQITGKMNISREDKTDPICEDTKIKEGILRNAPAKEGRFFKVKRVLE
jgi:aspartyl-tRNA(Asn)/glutamyl-tRNA(Gln) amidotransferase subunit C